MSNRAQIVAGARSKIQEVAADQWSDSRLQSLANDALRILQSYILPQDANAFMEESVIDIQAGKSRVPLPAGFIRMLWLGWGDATNGYRPMMSGARKLINMKNRDDVSVSDVPSFAIVGGAIVLDPVPQQAQVQGMMMLWVPTLTMADDNDIPAVALLMHEFIAIKLAQLALQDVAESRQDLIDAEKEILNTLPIWYVKRDGIPDRMEYDGGPNMMSGTYTRGPVPPSLSGQ